MPEFDRHAGVHSVELDHSKPPLLRDLADGAFHVLDRLRIRHVERTCSECRPVRRAFDSPWAVHAVARRVICNFHEHIGLVRPVCVMRFARERHAPEAGDKSCRIYLVDGRTQPVWIRAVFPDLAKLQRRPSVLAPGLPSVVNLVIAEAPLAKPKIPGLLDELARRLLAARTALKARLVCGVSAFIGVPRAEAGHLRGEADVVMSRNRVRVCLEAKATVVESAEHKHVALRRRPPFHQHRPVFCNCHKSRRGVGHYSARPFVREPRCNVSAAAPRLGHCEECVAADRREDVGEPAGSHHPPVWPDARKPGGAEDDTLRNIVCAVAPGGDVKIDKRRIAVQPNLDACPAAEGLGRYFGKRLLLAYPVHAAVTIAVRDHRDVSVRQRLVASDKQRHCERRGEGSHPIQSGSASAGGNAQSTVICLSIFYHNHSAMTATNL